MATESPKPPWVIRRERIRTALVRRLAEDERVLAEGAAHDRSPRMDGEGGEDHAYMLVTPLRIVWSVSQGVLSLRFDAVAAAEEASFAHRWYLRLRHERIRRPERYRNLPWDLPAHVGLLRRAHRVGRETVFQFSRRDTEAAKAIRARVPPPRHTPDLALRRPARGTRGSGLIRIDPPAGKQPPEGRSIH